MEKQAAITYRLYNVVVVREINTPAWQAGLSAETCMDRGASASHTGRAA